MDYLMENIEFDSLKRHISFYFIPIVNVDGVKYGSNVANLTGSVLMDYWRNPHQVYQAEVHYVKEFLAKIHQETPLSLILSFTSNYDNLSTIIEGSRNDGEEIEDSRVFPFILSKRNRLIDFEKSQFY